MELGLRRGTVAVEPHQAEWEAEARETIARLRSILRDAATDVQHVGSTAIRGIWAKPIIDIAVGVPDFQPLLDRNADLEANGFIFRGEDHSGQLLYVCGGPGFRTHHIHAVIYQSEAWNNYLNLRDYLNCHEADAQAYSELKQALAGRYPDDREAYTARKSPMVQEILTKARRWREAQGGAS